jgi:hypothetical protein
MMHADRFHGKHEKQVLRARDLMVETFLLQGVSVIVDDTNFNPRHEERLRQIAEGKGAAFRVQDFTDVPLHTCIERDQKREKSVGEKVIRRMYKQYLAPTPAPRPAYIIGLPDAVLVDIDGTLAKMGPRSPYAWDRVGEDTPHADIIDLVDTLRESGAQIIFISGRDGSCHDETSEWLAKYVGDWTREALLLMREEKDSRRDSIVKEEIYRNEIERKYNVWFVLDDRDQVVEMWRSLGLRCLQVAPGAF